MNIKIVTEKINLLEVKKIAREIYGDMVKGVVDIERGIIALGGEWHIDAKNALIENGSKPKNLWGFNFHFNKEPKDQIEYVSLINIRPTEGNRDMIVEDRSLREVMRVIIEKLIS